MIVPGFPFYRQEMALAITQQVPVFTAEPGSFLPCTGCKEADSSPFGYLKQYRTQPAEHCPPMLQTRLSHLVHSVWCSVCQYTDSSPSAGSFSKAASMIRMQLSNDAQNTQPPMVRNQPQCYRLVLGGCPQAQRQLDPCLCHLSWCPHATLSS